MGLRGIRRKRLEVEKERNNLKKNDLFFCYDVVLHRELQDKGFEYLTSAISNSNRRFWLYYKSPDVKQIVDQHFSK